MPGVFVGLAVGVISMASLFVTHHDPFLGVSAGFLGLCANFALAITISLLTPSVSFNSSTACNK
jgi:solute:Na+ symporter, SSS family